jgi:hypothetical protein
LRRITDLRCNVHQDCKWRPFEIPAAAESNRIKQEGRRVFSLRPKSDEAVITGGRSLLPDHLQPWNGLLKGNWPADAGPMPDQNAVDMVRKFLGGFNEESRRPDLAIIMYCRAGGASNNMGVPPALPGRQ